MTLILTHFNESGSYRETFRWTIYFCNEVKVTITINFQVTSTIFFMS